MYLWKIERREKIEQIVRERERQRLEVHQRKWSRREESDFYRTISAFGVEYDRKRGRFDWIKFRAISRLEKKFDDTMTEYYKAFCAMCKRTCGMKLNEDEEYQDLPVDPLPEDKARKTLERLELLSKIREETLHHPQLDERLRLCQVSADVPEWWVPGKHDKDLLVGASKHGLGRTDFFILNDPELSFIEVLRKHQILDQQGGFMKDSPKVEEDIKFERPEDILKNGKNEIIVKLEKGEGTLKIEKIGVKKETKGLEEMKSPVKIEKDVTLKEEKNEVELTLVKTCIKTEKIEESGKGVVENFEMELNDAVPPSESRANTVETPATTEETTKGEAASADETTQQVDRLENKSPTDDKPTEMETEDQPPTPQGKEMEQDDATEVEQDDGTEVEQEVDPEQTADTTPEESTEQPEETEDPQEEVMEVDNEDNKPNKNGAEDDEEKDDEEGEESEKVEKNEEDNTDPETTNEKEPEKTTEDKMQTETEEAKEEELTEAEVGETESMSGGEQMKVHPVADACETDSEKARQKPESDTWSLKEEESLDSIPVKKKLPDSNTQAAELKAMFPDLEVIQPLSRLSEMDTFVLGVKAAAGEALDYPEPTVAQLLAQSYQNSIKWPKDHALQVRLQHIVHAVERNEWPVPRNFTAYTPVGLLSAGSAELDLSCHDTPNVTPKRDTSTPMSLSEGSEVITITTDHGTSRLPSTKKRKRHIAIDVETERAKLHALLNSSNTSQQPTPLTKPSPSHWETNDESLSEESRRSTPVAPMTLQPPPAHQQISRVLSMPFDLKYHSSPKNLGPTVIPGTSSTLTPIDLSSGLPKMSTPDIARTNKDMMNEVQDFSMPSKNKQKSKLDDMLGKLMKKNNCPAEEPVVGKEKKRRKLDEIVLGLSAAKEQKTLFSDLKKSSPSVTSISPSVTVTPTSLNVSQVSSAAPKPFTITVTSVPSPATPGSVRGSVGPMLSLPTPKESFSSFLAHAEQQNLLIKKQQQQQSALSQAASQRKTYESMIADLSKVADFSSKISSYSHEAKVNKWLAEQTSLMPEQPLASDYLSAPRRRRPRVDPSLLDWKKLTGEENVSVINRVTGKKITGTKAPQLKRLGQWLLENPMFDVDPKWADLVKERGNLPHDLQKRLPPIDRKKGPGRPPLMASPPGQQPSVSQANLATSMASSLPFPSLATAGLSGLNPSSLLSGLSLGGFDPKNNPLLMPFGGMPNMSALGTMSGLGNLGNMSLTNSLFANLAGLGLPSLAGMDGSELSGSGPSTSNKGKSRKSNESDRGHGSSKPPPVSSASSLPSSALPFFFPNPSLLYTPLGLGGLNPFSMQPGAMTSAYDSLAQQCGLLNGSLGVSGASTSTSQSTSRTHKAQSSSRAATVTSSSANHRHQRGGSREALDRQQQQLQQLLLPHDTHLLESLSRASSMEAALRSDKKAADKRARDQERKEALEHRNALVDFAARPDDKGSKKAKAESDRKEMAENLGRNFMSDISSRTEEWLAKKSRENEMKEALENLCKTSAEFLARNTEERPNKRTRDVAMKEALEGLVKNQAEPLERPVKRSREDKPETLDKKHVMEERTIPTVTDMSVDVPVDIEALLPPSTVAKTGAIMELPVPVEPAVVDQEPPEEVPERKDSTSPTNGGKTVKPGGRKPRSNKRAKQVKGEGESDIPVVERKVLRSSAGRAAAAAAARAAAAAKAAEEEARREHSENAKDNTNMDQVEPTDDIAPDTKTGDKGEA